MVGYFSRRWSKKKLLNKLNWLSIRQLIYFHTTLQAHKTITTGKPVSMKKSITTEYPYVTRRAAHGQIRYGETFRGDSDLVSASFKHRALHCYNAVPTSVRTGTLATVKQKLKVWVKQNIPIDWG